MNLVEALRLKSEKNQPLSWALNSSKVFFDNGQKLDPGEQIAFALGVQLADQTPLKLAIEYSQPSPRKAMALCMGILIADIVARSTSQPLVQEDILLITRQVGHGLAELKAVHIEGTNFRDIWSLERASTAKRQRHLSKPRILVSAPRISDLLSYPIHKGVVVIDASHPLTLERLDDLLIAENVSGILTKIVILPLGYTSITDKFHDWTVISFTQEQSLNENKNSIVAFSVCDDKNLDNELHRARQKLSFLSKQFTSNPPNELLKAWGIYNRLSNISVSLGKYEEHASRNRFALPVLDRLNQLKASHNPILTKDIEVIWHSEWTQLTDSLFAAYEELKGDVPSKFWAVATSVEESIQKNFPEPMVVVCPTNMEADLLLRDLSFVCSDIHNYLHPDGLLFATPKTLASQSEWHNHKILSTGTYSSRWRYLYATRSNHEIIVYPHEVLSEKSVVSWIYNTIQARLTDEYHLNLLPELGLYFNDHEIQSSNRDDKSNIQVQISVSGLENLPTRRSNEERQSNSLVSLDIPAWAWDAEDITYVPPLVGNSSNPEYRIEKQNTTDYVEILLEHGSLLQVPSDHVFDVYRRFTDEIDECVAFELEAGDTLILIVDSRYSRLFDRIVEAYEAHPNYALLSVWMKLWEFAKQEALEKCGSDIGQLHKSITDENLSVTEQAVRSWFVGVMAPREEALIYRIIEKSGMSAAINHKEEIRSTLGHVRGMRRSLGRRMHRLLRDVAVSGQDLSNHNFKDFEEIAIEDVLAATQFAVVKNVHYLKAT